MSSTGIKIFVYRVSRGGKDYKKPRHASLFFHPIDEDEGTIVHAAGLKGAFAVERKSGYDPRRSARLVGEVSVAKVKREIPTLVNIARQASSNNEDAGWNCQNWVGEALMFLVNANVLGKRDRSEALDKMVDLLLEAADDQPY